MIPIKYRFQRPEPPRLSEQASRLVEIEQSHWYTNYGPVNARFEDRIVRELYSGDGACVTVNNATTGLILAVQQVLGEDPEKMRGKYALMPSFTFAATAQAAVWNGLRPVFCDVDPLTWLVPPEVEAAAIEKYRDQIAVIIVCTTFGAPVDCSYYEQLSKKTGIPIVIDAAGALGTYVNSSEHWGKGFSMPIVFSMHATKVFATAEAGLIYSENAESIQQIRSMSNFGFDQDRVSFRLGMNGKLSEIGALLCDLKLNDLDSIVKSRVKSRSRYESQLKGKVAFQKTSATQQAHQFIACRIPGVDAKFRNHIVNSLKSNGIEARTYFSPHLAEHPYFLKRSESMSLKVTQELADQILSLPLYNHMSDAEVDEICDGLKRVF